MELIRQVKTAIIIFIVLSLLTGFIYPIAITGISQIFFSWQANGSFIEKEGRKIGSLLIGQSFTNAEYFWGRPSLTQPFPYNASDSSGSNLGPSNTILLSQVKERILNLRQSSQGPAGIPIDLVTASASGLDPDISIASALFQVPRIALARHISASEIQQLIKKIYKRRTFGLLGEKRVNVLELNMALDQLAKR